MMQTETNTQSDKQKKGRIIFLLMAFFFTVPIIIVVIMYRLNWKPTGQSIGELVTPPRLIAVSETLKDYQLKPLNKFWDEKWNIVFVAEQCEAVCLSKLHDMRQIHVSTYKDMLRVQRVLITWQTDVKALHEMYPEMMIINQSKDDVLALAHQFNMGNEQAFASNRTYLVDPLGHIMMSYQETSKPADIRKDLTRLLKFSWAG